MQKPKTVALVLAGGGARGAYEIGALSALLPELDRRGERPKLVVGTSVGALNAAFLAATAHLPVAEAVAEGERIWKEIRYRKVLHGLGSLAELKRGLAYLGEVAGLRLRVPSVLDPAPLERTLAQSVSFGKLTDNVADGRVQAAVVTTAAATSRSVVFHTQSPSPPSDERRGIDYMETSLSAAHVRASAAIPAAFPAVWIERPEAARGWHFDGGTRLNTPIKPALALGADRVVVIGLNSIAGGRQPGPEEQPRADRQPDALAGASQLLHAVLVDPLVNDIATLAAENRLLEKVRGEGAAPPERRVIPYVFVAPEEVDEIGRVAARVFQRHYGSARALLRSPDLALLGRLVDGASDAQHGELLSYLFFAPELARELLQLGRRDAQRWLGEGHDDGPWQTTSPLPQES